MHSFVPLSVVSEFKPIELQCSSNRVSYPENVKLADTVFVVQTTVNTL